MNFSRRRRSQALSKTQLNKTRPQNSRSPRPHPRRELEALEPRWVLDSVVVFNELMYHPSDSDTRGEWVELRNLLSIDVDLSDWSITGGVDYHFPPGSKIPADGYLVVAAAPEQWAGSPLAPVAGPFAGSLANQGEDVRLRNNSDRIMDEITYNDRTPWPVAADGGGPSLAKRNPYWTSSDVTNWEASQTARGTPGADNLPSVDTTPSATQVVELTSTWRYNASNTDQGTAWREPDFNDSQWPNGQGAFYAGVSQGAGDQLRVVPLDPAGDGDIGGGTMYTHTLDFGNADSGASINGVTFARIGTDNLLTTPGFQWTNSSGIRSQSKPTGVGPLPGPLRDIYQDYVGNTLNLANGTAQIVLQNLSPGTRYLTRIFSRKNNDTPRNTTLAFTNGANVESLTMDQTAPNFPDPDQPYAIDFEFTAATDQLRITATQHDATHPWLWYGLTNEVATLTGNTELPNNATTQYFRHAFNYLGEQAADHELQLRMLADDGAVVYLNGKELTRHNLPAGVITFATPANSDTSSSRLGEVLVLPANELRLNQPNVLAVELHRANAQSDIRFGMELSVVESLHPLVPPPVIQLNELPGSSAAQRWIELRNDDLQAVDLQSLKLEVHGSVVSEIPLPAQMLAPGAILSVAVPANVPAWQTDDAIILYAKDSGVAIDAQTLANGPRGRSAAHDGRWLMPSASTPGAANQFTLTEQVVIHEIMYHAPPQFAQGEQPYQESSEQWIELFNRGATPVDLSAWSLAGGISFDFPAGTTLPAGGYLVVANNAAELRARWPEANIIGNLSGNLSNSGERIDLRDAQGNPADEVHYYDSGAWPTAPDRGGASLELTDPFADNSRGGAWAASRIEAGPWVTVTYEGTARPPQASSDPTDWNEFILGLLDAGEILLDDVSVIEDPNGAAIERMQNGKFDAAADHWRLVGDHGQHGLTRVVADPDNAANQVLHVVAHGATEHMSNHLETTFVGNARIVSTQTYRISFRAKWLSGSPQVHTRLYFNRLAKTTILPMTSRSGTPGAANSQHVDNAGPTFNNLAHSPVVPVAGESVTVSVQVHDPQGLNNVKLFFAEDGQAFQSLVMQSADGGRYSATIPGKTAGKIVQFYVSATDSQGATSYFPAGGEESRALYRVREAISSEGPRHKLRILMTSDDLNEMFTSTNVTSNERQGATFIWQESEVYYNIDVRFKGSGFSRGSGSTGFNLRFASDQLLFGEHETVAIDRTGGPWGLGASQRELTIKHIANRAGDIPMMYDDVITLLGPRDSLSGSAQFLVARYDDVFLDSQYENGSDGTRYKFELIYYSTLTVDGNREGLKLSPGNMAAGVFPVRGVDMPDMGDDPNAYRWHYLIRNNRDRDDYAPILALTDALSVTGSTVGGELDRRTQAVMDVDQWMRVFAFESLAGINDTFNQGLQHNLQLYARPSDGRIVPLPWDMDFALHQDTSMSIYGSGSRLTRVINIPTNRRVFQQHLLDIIETAYNPSYLEPWLRHLATRSQQDNTAAILTYVTARRNFVMGRLAAQIPFEITTPDKDNLVVDTPQVTLAGKGWINVRDVRRAGQADPLPVRWLDGERWEVVVPLDPGTQTIELQAYDLRGMLVGSSTAQVTSNAVNPLIANLRVTELNYHPSDPTAAELAAGWSDADDFEFVELTNIGDTPLSLAGVKFVDTLPDGSTSGIRFDFGAQSLLPGAALVVAQDPAAFTARYGAGAVVIGPYAGQLANGGETLSLLSPAGELIQRFTYDDAWYPDTDGLGATLEIRSPSTTPVDDWSLATAWHASRATNGTPGQVALPDFNGDQTLNALDIDLLCAALEGNESRYDLDFDQDVDLVDLEVLVLDKMRSQFGDVNFDGRFGTSDLVLIFQRGEYEDAVGGNSTWEDGDWNCDGDFTTADLVFALQQGGFDPEG